MKYIISFAIFAFISVSYAQSEQREFALGNHVDCGGSYAIIEARLVNGKFNLKWSGGAVSRNVSLESCENITPIQNPGPSEGKFPLESDIHCSGYFGKIIAILQNGKSDIKWTSNAISRNVDVSSCENVSPVKETTLGNFSVGSQIDCSGYLARVDRFLANGKADITFESNAVSRNVELSQCQNISESNSMVLAKDMKVGSDIECGGYFGRITAVLQNGHANIQWASNAKTRNANVSDCENVSVLEQLEVNDSVASSQKDQNSSSTRHTRPSARSN